MHWWWTKIHISWLIACASASFVLGVWLCLYGTAPAAAWIFAAVGLVACLLFRFRIGLPLLVACSVVLGISYGARERDTQSRVHFLHGQVVMLSGVIREDVTRDAKDGVKVQVYRLKIADRAVAGSVWVSGVTKQELLRGDTITVTGQLREGFGTFVGTMYRVSFDKVVRSIHDDPGRLVRDWFAAKIRLGIDEPQASLGTGYLTGQKSALPEDLSESLQIAGLTHIVVASGYNLTILVRLARKLFIKWSRYLSAVSAGLMVVSFVAVTGLSPSMTRAGIVSGLSLLAWYYGRNFHPLVLLPFVACLTVLWQPSYAWGDLGWQLSFAAFLGVMVVGPLLQRYFFGRDPPGVLRQVLGETVAAHLVTIPIVVSAFGALSHVAIIANIMIVPLVPLAMLLTFIVGMTAIVLPVVVDWVALPAQILLTYMTTVATWLAELPWAQSHFEPAWWMLVGYTLLLTALCWHMQRVSGFKLREVNPLD